MPFLDETGLKRVWSKMLDKTHPVGALYWSSNSTNPGTLFGGTWVQIKDKFILAAGDKYRNGTTGGSADAVVVSHTHSIPKLSGNLNDDQVWIQYGDGTGSYNTISPSVTNIGAAYRGALTAAAIRSTGLTTNASTTGSQGVSGAGKNMPPYETYYCWKRTA